MQTALSTVEASQSVLLHLSRPHSACQTGHDRRAEEGTAHSLPSSLLSSLRHTVLEQLFVLSKEWLVSHSTKGVLGVSLPGGSWIQRESAWR